MNVPTGLRLGVAAAFLFFISACGGGDDGADSEGAVEVSQEAVQEGEALFTGSAICYTCHGMNAEGTQLAPDLTDDEWLNITEPVTPDKIVSVINSGVQEPVEHQAPMPPQGGASLTDEQVESLAAYVYQLSQ